MTAWTIAAAQYTFRHRSVAENVSHHLRFIETAAQQACDLIVFPELSLCGSVSNAPLPPQPDNELLQPLHYAATRHEITIVAGLPVDVGTEQYKGVVIFKPGVTKAQILLQSQGVCLSNDPKQISLFTLDAEGYELDPNASLLATGIFAHEYQQQYLADQLQSLAHHYAIAVLRSNYSTGSALWDEQGQLIVKAGNGELLLTGRRSPSGWEGEIIPMQQHVHTIDECYCRA